MRVNKTSQNIGVKTFKSKTGCEKVDVGEKIKSEVEDEKFKVKNRVPATKS